MGIRSPKHWLPLLGQISVMGALVASFAPPLQGRGELGPLGIALVVAFLVLSLGIHEAAHAWVAWRCGDPTAKDLGRMTLNPIPHIDPMLTIVVPAVLALMHAPIFGGAKPVPVSYHRLRNPLRDMALVALAGPASNFLIAILFAFAWKWCVSSGGYAHDSLMALVLSYSMFANIVLTAFNLLPIPPLDGSRVMTWLLPAGIREGYASLERFGILLVLLLLYLGPVRVVVNQMVEGIWYVINSITAVAG